MTDLKENSSGLISFSRDEVKVGDKLYLRDEKRGYKVQARNDRYIIVTKPYFGSVIYSILDLNDKWMGPDNCVFSSHNYETKEDCEEALSDLIEGEFEISQRRGINLVVPNKHISQTNKF